MVFVRAPKRPFCAHTKPGQQLEIHSFHSLGNTDSTLSALQEEETLSLLALAGLQAPEELTVASQNFHAEKSHS